MRSQWDHHYHITHNDINKYFSLAPFLNSSRLFICSLVASQPFMCLHSSYKLICSYCIATAHCSTASKSQVINEQVVQSGNKNRRRAKSSHSLRSSSSSSSWLPMSCNCFVRANQTKSNDSKQICPSMNRPVDSIVRWPPSTLILTRRVSLDHLTIDQLRPPVDGIREMTTTATNVWH